VPPTVAASASTAGRASTRSVASPAPPRPPERLTDASLDGIGPVAIGMTLPQASAAARTTLRITGTDMGTECRYAEADDGPVGVDFMVIGGRVVRVDVLASPPEPRPSPVSTLSGIHIGSLDADVTATYPGQIQVSGHPSLEGGHYLVYEPTSPASRAFGLIFETDGQRVTSFRSGEADAVQAIEGCA
jgi:hypothetical protein